jgi:hypothetical protein
VPNIANASTKFNDANVRTMKKICTLFKCYVKKIFEKIGFTEKHELGGSNGFK